MALQTGHAFWMVQHDDTFHRVTPCGRCGRISCECSISGQYEGAQYRSKRPQLSARPVFSFAGLTNLRVLSPTTGGIACTPIDDSTRGARLHRAVATFWHLHHLWRGRAISGTSKADRGIPASPDPTN